MKCRPLQTISLALRDPADPFGGSTGKSSRVLPDGDRLVQASEWPLLASLAGVSGPLGHADLPALAAALEDAGFAGALPVQAIVLTDQSALSAGSPGAGLPPWRLGLFVDLSDGKTDHAAAVFSYPTRAQAEASARRLTEAWPKAQSRMMNSAFETRLPLKAIRVTRNACGPDLSCPWRKRRRSAFWQPDLICLASFKYRELS